MSFYALCKAEATCIGQLANYVRQKPAKTEPNCTAVAVSTKQ